MKTKRRKLKIMNSREVGNRKWSVRERDRVSGKQFKKIKK